MNTPKLLQQILKETLLCAARQIPVAGKVVDVWAGVSAQRARLADQAAVKSLDERLSRFERGQRALACDVVREVLESLRQPQISPQKLSDSLRELQEMQSQGYMVALFEALLQGGTSHPELIKNPSAYGQVLEPQAKLYPGMMPIFLELEGLPRVLQAPLSSLSSLLSAQVEGEEQLLGGSVWGLPPRNILEMQELPCCHLILQDKAQGPFRAEQLASLLKSGKVAPSTLAWIEGMSGWQPLERVEALQILLKPQRPAPPPLPPEIFSPEEEILELQCLWDRGQYRPQEDLMCALLRLTPNESLLEQDQETRVPVHHLLILDLSGSMNSPDKYPRLKEALQHYREAIAEEDLFSLIPFSTTSEMLIQAQPLIALEGWDLAQLLDRWSGRFYTTRLSPALRLAMKGVEEAQRSGFSGVTRIFCMSDGFIDDPIDSRLGLAALFKREIRVDLLGFGSDFALKQAEELMGGSSLGNIRYVEEGGGQLAEYFSHLARTSQRILIHEALLKIQLLEHASCFRIFSCRPTERFLGEFSDQYKLSLEIPIGSMEARKSYLFLLELRAWEAKIPLGRLELKGLFRGRAFQMSLELEAPLGEHQGRQDDFIANMAMSLDGLSGDSTVDEIEATQARIKLYELEQRPQRYIEALRRKLEILERGGSLKEQLSLDDQRYAEADAATCTKNLYLDDIDTSNPNEI